MSAGKGKSLSPAFLANTWRPGQSGNPRGHSGLYGEAVKLARGLSLRAVQRLGELMESEDERVSVVACNSLLDRAFGKPKPAVEEKDDVMEARLKTMSREERLALLQELLEPMRKYLPPGEDAEQTVVGGEAVRDRTAGAARLAGPRHSR
jgi:predicted Zn-dependent protease